MILSLCNHIAALVPVNVVTVARPSLYSCLKVNNRSFRHASPVSSSLDSGMNFLEHRQPVDDESQSLSSHLSPVHHHHFHYVSLHLCSKTYLFYNPSHHSLPRLFGPISRIFMTISNLTVHRFFCFVLLFSLFV